jgi:acyl-coenzyme A thioesterase PaaI-like protein
MVTYEGSGNAEGRVTELNSTFGYIINSHLSMDAGLSIYFVHPPSSKEGTAPGHAIRNPFVDLNYSTKWPILLYASTLTDLPQ